MKKIMLVDDDEQITAVFGELLGMESFQVTAVNDSSKAHETAVSFSPDMFLLDVMMPEPNGFELCRILRADQQFMFTPIFLVTALDDDDSRIVAYGAGATDYITKPFPLNELVEKLRKFDGYIPSSAAHEIFRMKVPKRPKHKDIFFKIKRAIQGKLNFPDFFNQQMRNLWVLLLALIIIFWLLIKFLPPIR